MKNKMLNNTKVVENYFFMTLLQVLSSILGIVIYPYLIRLLGAETYGNYVFAIAIISYFTGIIAFGFQLPGLKLITQNIYENKNKGEIVSGILSAKFYLTILCSIIFFLLLFIFTDLYEKRLLLIIVYTQIIAELFNPTWYFQAVQKMKIVTYYQLFFRFISLPLIFIFVRTANDLYIFALISSTTVVLPALLLIHYLIFLEKIKIRLVSFSKTRIYFKEALPLFVSSFLGTIKQESVTVLIGIYFGMKDVALYDLANKIIIFPRMLLNNINVAIFPKMNENLTSEKIKKTIRYEWIIGILMMTAVTLFGYPLVLLLGGPSMTDAYLLAVILSFTILVWLVVGSYIYFIFIPKGLNYYVTLNQGVALISFFLFVFPAFFFFKSIIAVVIALSLSGLAEIIYCRITVKKNSIL